MRRVLSVAALALLLVRCRPASPDSQNPPPTAQTAASPTPPGIPAAPTPSAPGSPQPAMAFPAAPSPSPSPSPADCGYGPATKLAELQNRDVREASGLAASGRTPGVYWTLNDSGNEPLLFAFDRDGRNLGVFRVDGARNEDWEALQTGPGRDGGPALYIGDAGDNRRARRESVIYRVPEPEVRPSGGKPEAGRTAPAEAFRFVFPDGPHDTEALLVHPRTGEIVLITKEFSGQSAVYRLPLPLDAGPVVTLERVGELDLRQLGPIASLVTDAAVSPDGRLVAVRTYTAALEYDLPPGAPLASVWSQPPRAYPLDDGPQGEGITYRADGKALLTIGEATPAVLFQATYQC